MKIWKIALIPMVVFFCWGSVFAGEKMTIKLFFIKNVDGGSPPSVAVSRTIPKTPKVLTKTLTELFKGPSDEEKRQGLVSAFTPESVLDYNTDCQKKRDEKMLQPLGSYFSGASVTKDGIAVIDFKPDAMCYLENTPSASYRVMEPIEKTAKQFPNVKSVEYSIDGKRVQGWDA